MTEISSSWKRAHERFAKDVTKIAVESHLPFRDMTDLVNTRARYPSLIPMLIDWLRNVEDRSGLTDQAELRRFRSGLYRSLTTVDAMGTAAIPLLFDSFYLAPPAPPTTLAIIGDALKYLAVPSDYARMREIAADRSLSFGRAPVLEWLLRQDPDDALPLAVGELTDQSVRAYILRSLRTIKNLPEALRSTVEPYLTDPNDEVRLQARKTLAHIDKGPR